jgi:hypothetical protein
MKLDEMLETIETSEVSDWTTIDRPTFAQDIQQVSGGDRIWVEVEEHHTLLSFRPNLSISIVLGLQHRQEFFEDWARDFPDQNASSTWVDFRYNGVPVYRSLRVLVDGARAALPCPTGVHEKDIPKRQYHIWQLLDQVTGSGRMDEYFARAGLKVVDRPWPRPND